MNPVEDVRAPKAALRERLRQALGQVSSAERAAASAAARVRLREQPVWRRARTILFFSPLPDELDLTPLAAEALTEGRTVAFPRYEPASECYLPARVADLHGSLARGRFGLPEPTGACAVLPLNLLDLVLVPGLGFDLSGRRLGRGKGYYDRLLATVSGVRCGVALDRQVLPAVPAGPQDIAVNCLLTPTRWLEFSGRAV